MLRIFRPFQLLATSVMVSASAFASPAAPSPSSPDITARIVDEGLNHSHVMAEAGWLSDHIGARLTNSPGIRVAERWAMDRFAALGLANVRRQAFPFGRGWSFETIHVDMVAPRTLQLHAVPLPWTPATAGAVTAAVAYAPMKGEADFPGWHGRLAGKWVMVDEPMAQGPAAQGKPLRLSADDLARTDAYPEPTKPGERPAWLPYYVKQAKLDAFLKAEGAAGMVRASSTPGQLVHGYGYQQDKGAALPGVELGAEDYGRLVRLAGSGGASIRIDSRARFDDSDRNAYNILADLPGSDAKAGYVTAGAHLDSMAWADGAADDGAGVAVVIEAARIITSLGLKTKRTIRFALWSGEEQGTLGSKAYVEAYLARRPASPPGADTLADGFDYVERLPVTKLPGYDELAAYFNIDDGSGRIRGVFANGNLAAMPILREMIAPFASMGVTQVSPLGPVGSDHAFMAAAGLPAFALIQDPLDYSPYGHHSDADTFDHLDGADLRQAAVVLASLLVQAANRPDPLPRTALPHR